MAGERTGPDRPRDVHADDVLGAVTRWREEGRDVALATVLRTWGSSPRQPGSQLAVNDRREFVGSVSGGCVEGAVVEEAVEVMGTGRPRTLEFGVSDEDAWAVGLACGGRVSIHVAPAGEVGVVERLLGDREERRAAVLATRLEDGATWLVHPLDESDPGAPAWLAEPARAAALRDRSGLVETPEGEVFLQVHNPPLRLVLVGAVHISQALAPMAALAGFDVTVVDPRTAFATDARFPAVSLDRRWPDEALPALDLDHRTAVVTLSHDPKLDDPALEAALRSPAFYVGALGSRRTHARRTERLRERGFSEAELERVHAPVGLDVGAVTPAEIAVSALAEIVARLRGAEPA